MESARLDLDYEISPPAEIAGQAEALFRGMAIGDGFMAVGLLEVAAAGFRQAKDVDSENRVLTAAAECWVSVADTMQQNPMLEAHRLAQAIGMYGRVRGQKERRNRAPKASDRCAVTGAGRYASDWLHHRSHADRGISTLQS